MNSTQLLIGVGVIAALVIIAITLGMKDSPDTTPETDLTTTGEVSDDSTTQEDAEEDDSDDTSLDEEEEREEPEEIEEEDDNSSVSNEPAGYTAAEVATHTTQDDCWTIVNGNVYDLTSFISRHPGGESNIMKLCGIDGTATFTAQHGGQGSPESRLESLYLGPLAQ